MCGAAAGSSERICFRPESTDSGAESGGDRDAGSGAVDAQAASAGRSAPAGGGSGVADSGAGGTGAGGAGAGDAGQPNPTGAGGSSGCATREVRAARTSPTVMLLVDGSSSMEQDFYESGTTRWAAVRTALIDPTTGVVPKLQSLVKFGLAVYGTGAGWDVFDPLDPNKCPLPQPIVMPRLDNLANITAGLGASPPGTFRPTGLALNAIVDLLPNGQSPDPDVTAEPQTIVLATDGNPNDCTPTTSPMPVNFQPSLDAAAKAGAKHQKLFVIGASADADRNHLQQVANLGAGLALDAAPGATVLYPEDTAQLAATLSEVASQGLDCDVTLNAGIVQGKECQGSVTLSDAVLECNGPNGWRLEDERHIRLLGTACASFKLNASVQLAVSFPCGVIIN